MSERSWNGKIYITQQGGDKILLRALQHYYKTLQNIGTDSRIKEMGASFTMIFEQEAQRTMQKIKPIISVLQNNDSAQVSSLQNEVELLVKALNCYESDILKIKQTMIEKNHDLFDEPKKMTDDLPLIVEAKQKISQFE